MAIAMLQHFPHKELSSGTTLGGRQPPSQSPFLFILFLLLKRGSSEGGRRGWDFQLRLQSHMLSPWNFVGWGMESTELGARDIHFPGTWNLGALDALLLLDGIWVSFLLQNVDLSI